MRKALEVLTATIAAVALAGCSEQAAPTEVVAYHATRASAVTQSHSEYDVNVNASFYLSCTNEMTLFVVTGHVTVDVLTTPTGNTSIRVQGRSDPSTSYLVRPNGVRYDMLGQGSTQLHEFVGPVHVLNIVDPKVFKSADGDVLVTNYHMMITFDDQGGVTGVTANGACP